MLLGILWVASVGALVAGLWVVATAAAHSRDVTVTVPVQIGPQAPAWIGGVWLCVADEHIIDGVDCGASASPDEWSVGMRLPVWSDDVLTTDPYLYGPWWTSLAAMTPVWGWLLAGGIAGLANVPVLREILTGQKPVRIDRRLAVTAGVVAATWAATTFGPYVAAGAVIRFMEAEALFVNEPPGDRAYVLPEGWLAPALRVTWWPAVVVALLLLLMLAVRHSRRLTELTERQV